MNLDARYPDVTARLTEVSGNVFSVIACVRKALRDAGHGGEVEAFTTAATECASYDAVLQLCMRWVNVE